MVDETKLDQFIGQMLNDLGGAVSIALVRMGDALGLYKALHKDGPMTVDELATKASVNARYLREWLSHQAASNYLSYDPQTQRFALPTEQAMVFAIDESPVNMIGAFDAMAAFLGNQEKSNRHLGTAAE
jgi:DNA-binding IclR family transcriptional regulator